MLDGGERGECRGLGSQHARSEIHGLKTGGESRGFLFRAEASFRSNQKLDGRNRGKRDTQRCRRAAWRVIWEQQVGMSQITRQQTVLAHCLILEPAQEAYEDSEATRALLGLGA